MLILVLPHGAHLAVCDVQCLDDVEDLLPARTPIVQTATWPTCASCFACAAPHPAPSCPCRVLGLSCSQSWLLSRHAADALSAIQSAGHVAALSEQGWCRLLELGEQVSSGNLAGDLWVREQQAQG